MSDQHDLPHETTPQSFKARFIRLRRRLVEDGRLDGSPRKVILQGRWQAAEAELGRSVSLEEAAAWEVQASAAGTPVGDLDDYYTCRGQIALHEAAIEQMKAEGRMFQNPTQGYWSPCQEHLDEYHEHMGVITLLRSLAKLGID